MLDVTLPAMKHKPILTHGDLGTGFPYALNYIKQLYHVNKYPDLIYKSYKLYGITKQF